MTINGIEEYMKKGIIFVNDSEELECKKDAPKEAKELAEAFNENCAKLYEKTDR